jgi:HD-like signal output (HDOD) protein
VLSKARCIDVFRAHRNIRHEKEACNEIVDRAEPLFRTAKEKDLTRDGDTSHLTSGAALAPDAAKSHPMVPDNQVLYQQLLTAVDNMQAFPVSVQNILKLTRDASCAPKDLVKVIDKDPVITVKVLRVVNSVYYGLPKKISSVDHAVVFLGFNTVKNLALSLAAVAMLPTNPLAGFDGHRYLLHCLTTAGITRQLSLKFPGSDPHDFFIAGLLHDFGKVVIAQVMPAEFKKALEFSVWNETSLHRALLEVVGIDHCEIGAMLLEKWHFPQGLIEAIRYQHDIEAARSPLTTCVFTANQISMSIGADFGGMPLPLALPPSIERVMGGTLTGVMASLGDLAPILQEARRFSRI